MPFLAEVELAGGFAQWRSEGLPPPVRLLPADDRTTAAAALARALRGNGLAYGGDWFNARQLLAAMGRRLATPRPGGPGVLAAFRAERARKRAEHEVLSLLAVPLEAGWRSPLPRAPPLAAALEAAFGASPSGVAWLPLREVLGAVGAHEWRRRGVEVPALGARVHPHYGVFAPVRGEYVELVASALRARGAGLLPAGSRAFDVGTGTGVLAALLAKAGARVTATDLDPRAVACARENLAALGLADAVEVVRADLFPPGRARLVVANPPWLPEESHGPLDRAVYDPGGAVLERLVRGLPGALEEGGEAWLVLSDLAERLGLRAEGALDALLRSAGLRPAAVLEARPTHPRARTGSDPVARARAAERTRLYVLSPDGAPGFARASA